MYCKKCESDKSEVEFYVSNKSQCKECIKTSVRANRKNNREYYLEFDRKRANLPHRIEARKAYSKTDQGRIAGNKAKKKWETSNPIKRGASHIVNNAVRDGRLSKPDECSGCCSGGRIHGHHDDYAFPLTVRWLCPQCLEDWHKENGVGKNG